MAEKKLTSSATMMPPQETEELEQGVSPFLRFQDKNGDNLPDVCDVEIQSGEGICKDCIPNPQAISRDWRKSNQFNPFLNEKICKYQISFETPEKTTGFVEGMNEDEASIALQELYKKYAEPAVIALLEGFQKDTSQGIVLQLLDVVEYTDLDLDTRANSRLKLLYSVNFQDLFSLPDAPPDDADAEPEELEDIEVSFEASAMAATNIRVRKGLNLYGRFTKVAKAVEGKTIRFVDSNKIFDFDDYGDNALFTGKSPVGQILQELDSFLNGRGYNIAGVAGGFFTGFGDDRVTKLTFIFSPQYDLKKLKVYTEACGTNRADVVYGKTKLKPLLNTESWKDKTAVAYFAKMKNIEQDLTARVPMPMEEFIVKHTYPKVFVKGRTDGQDEVARTVDSCIRDALENDFKELGQDIFDEVFSLADAIAYKFHKNLCQKDPSEVNEESVLKGLNFGAGPGPESNIFSMAKVQAYETINAEDSAFAQLCFRMLSMGASGVECGLSPIQQLDQLYTQGLDRIAICGLMDLFLEAMQCLFKGLSLEEALASIIRAALNAMGVSQVGELFVGLPADKQRELEKAVNQKLESGDIFSEGSPGQATSDIIAKKQNAPDAAILKKFKNKKPWQDKKFVEAQDSRKRPDNYGNMVPSRAPSYSADDSPERRTIGQKLQAPMGANYETNNIILNAYIEAFMEVYKDNYLELIDLLNKFPGAQLISSIIATLDCPTPPLFNPGFDDFFKSLQLPFCRNTAPITFPRWENPFLYIPKLTDILAAIFEALKRLVLCVIMRVIVLILAKTCEIIGDAICKALEVTGQITAGLLSGNANVGEIMRETICGPTASDETINNTILDLMENFGVGGAAFADPERTISLFGDFINSSNREEALTMFVDGPNRSQLQVFRSLIDLDYPEYADALPNNASIERMFRNIGNVIPASVMDDIKQGLSLSADSLGLPMNPTLCATPEDLASFEEVRCDLLAGRMSTEQCKAQTIRARDQVLESANDLAKMINEGVGSVLESETPPIFSDPGCTNGLLPSEPEESIKTATGALKGDMESLQIAYTDDMLGNGGLFGGNDDWGFINMVLSDTFANPYTAHQRKTFNSDRFVDFYIPTKVSDKGDDENDLSVAIPRRQRGAYPKYVGGWLKYQMLSTNGANDLRINFSSTNDTQTPQEIRKTFKELGFDGLFDTDVNLTELQDFGYNSTIGVDYEEELITVTREARKKTPDVTLSFRDNSKGYRTALTNYAYGFDIRAFYSDIAEYDQDDEIKYRNRPNDNMRIQIKDYVNQSAKVSSPATEKLNDEAPEPDSGESSINEYIKYEFFAIDNTLENVEITEQNYPQLFDALYIRKRSLPPQVYALSDMINIDSNSANILYNTINQNLYANIRQTIGNNEDVWLYGANFDELSTSDYDYGINVGGEFVEYENYRVSDYNEDGEVTGTRKVNNDDAILGISRDAFNNRDSPQNIRVHYLSPTQFGQNYMSPSLYVVPTKNTGWLGAVNLMFPEYTPCKPRETNLIAFNDIQKKIDDIYPRIPEDKRLKSDPNCVLEVPFNRVLTRPSRAGIESVVTAMIRIFTSTHFIKSLATFATFEPKFPENYSNIYGAYIIEVMEESCRESGGNFLSPFKDDEFWYAFLEQAVQIYSRRLDDDLDESITPENVPVYVQEAIEVINNLQDNYNYPNPKEFRNAPAEEKSNFQTLKGFREEKNLEAVQSVEEQAKLILLELVKEQLSFTSELFKENLKNAGFAPSVVNTDYYVIETMTDGGAGLNLAGATTFVETVDNTELEEAIESGSGYTTGNMFALQNGNPYIGDFHVHVDEMGNTVFMVGPAHTDYEHELLVPYANNVVVSVKNSDDTVEPMGDIAEELVGTTDKPFYIRKYVSINGGEIPVKQAEDMIRQKKSGNLSDYYPGSMKLVSRPNSDRAVGLRGELGVKHGIEFGVNVGGTNMTITTVEIGALDLPVAKFSGPKANSKLLLCLLNNLRDDEKFRLALDYVFSMKKAVSTFAIYNDMGFLPSIGEYTVGKRDVFTADTTIVGTPTGEISDAKPGGRMVLTTDEAGNPDFTVEYTEGWAAESDRNKLFASPFFKKWDEWDQLLLRKSVRRVKKIFRPYYRKRKFEVEDETDMGPGNQYLSLAKARFTSLPGGQTIPLSKRKKLKPNPFNSRGQICKKPD